LSFSYPPHLRLVNEGYAVAGRWIAADPGRFLRLLGRKLSIFWSGAALGVTGFDLPLGPSGVRRAVDMVAPEGPWTRGWQLLVLGGALWGALAALREPALQPWLLFVAARLWASALFFGYARHGALIVPALVLLFGVAFTRAARHKGAGGLGPLGWLFAGLALALLIEGVRWHHGPRIRIDGRPVVAADPFPGDLHRDQRVDFDW